MFKEEFGEQMVGKKTPGVFIYNLLTNEIKQIATELKHWQYPQFPIFDEHSTGLVLTAVEMPVKKLGIVYCLNRHTGLYYISDPKPVSDEAEKAEGYLKRITDQAHFVALQPKFSPDYKKLSFFGSRDPFHSHTTNYQLFVMQWPLKSEGPQMVDCVIEKVPKILDDEFAGLYGYQGTFVFTGFLNNRFYLASSEYKGMERIYIVDTDTK
jgi:hypothetical protein